MKKSVMKKLVLLSLSAVAALSVSMSAAVQKDFQTAVVPQAVTHVAELKTSANVSDPFAGITLSADQKERLDLLLSAVRYTPADSAEQHLELSHKALSQIRKILTADQYVKYLENIAEAQEYLPGL